MNGYNFTENVRRSLALAREEASRLHHEYVGTEHILLGVCRTEGCNALEILRRCDVNPADLIGRVESTVKRGNPSAPARADLPYTSRAKKSLELSMSEARHCGHHYVGTEHLLLGLLREEKGIGAQVLVDSGLAEEAARAQLVEIVKTGHVEREPPRRSGPTRTLSANLAERPWHELPDRLRLVLAMAHGCAGELGLHEVAPLHVAVALLEHGHGAANAALHTLGFDRASALAELTKIAGTAVSPGVAAEEIRSSAELGTVLTRTSEEQSALGARRPGTEHVLLALLELSPEVAAVFTERGLTAETLRKEVRRNTG